METQLSFERMNEDDCHGTDSSRGCALENGKMTSQLRDVDVVSSCLGDTDGVSLCPATPIPCRKNGESVLVISTPLSLEYPKSPSIEGLDSIGCDNVVSNGCDDSPRTPKEGVFNPFAPGPEAMCLAPCKKIVKESRRIVARRLNFDDVDDPPLSIEDDKEVEIRLEKMLFETVYGILLEAIILKQTEDFLAENRDLELEGCRTPTSPLPLSGISETCPATPVKGTTRKLLNIDPGLCRKLEF